MIGKVIIFFCVIILIRADMHCNYFQRLYRKDCNNFNPDEYLDVPQMISRHGYPSETHVVVTEDGYFLELHRIPGSRDGNLGVQPVFLQHGLLESSADWLVNRKTALGFLLADKGYDVWLGNARGNTYSKGHVSLSINSPAYWNFSFHEMAIKDLPAALYYVSNFTNKPGEIIYIGHSMGTTTFFILSSLLPHVAENVKVMVALGPAAYVGHIKSAFKYFVPFIPEIEWLSKYFGMNQLLPRNKILDWLESTCFLTKINEKLCIIFIQAFCGFDKNEFNTDILPVFLSKTPAGTSIKTLLHYVQQVKHAGKFQQYDYGPKGNMIEYGTLTPPQYNTSLIQGRIFFMYGMRDGLTDPIDVKLLYPELPNGIGLYRIMKDNFNHLDFLCGKHAETLVYKPLLTVISNYTIK